VRAASHWGVHSLFAGVVHRAPRAAAIDVDGAITAYAELADRVEAGPRSASTKLEIDSIQIQDVEVGSRHRVRVKKNKVAPPFREAEFDIIYGEGISSLGEIIDLGTEYDIIEKRGSWYSYEDDTIAQGREATIEWLEENDEEREEIAFQIRKELGMLTDAERDELDAEAAEEENEAEAEEA